MSKNKSIFEQALAAEGFGENLSKIARSIFQQETSSGENAKTSNVGARGLMQVMPATFGDMADKGWNIDDPMHNVRAGLRYIKMLSGRKGGDNPALVAAGYYGGPGGMDKARQGIAVSDPRNPNAPTTLEYGRQVAERMGVKSLKGDQAGAPVNGGGARVPVPVAAKEPAAQPPVVVVQPEVPQAVPLPMENRGPAVAPAPQGRDSWNEFANMVGARGAQAPQANSPMGMASYGMPAMQVKIPDFAAAVQQQRANQTNMAAFRGWGRQQR